MKKRILILSLLITVSITTTLAQEDGIQFFEGSWAEILAQAKNLNKVIFMDAYATWCGPCKQMSANVFPQKEVGGFFNANFLSVKMDMEKGDGLALAKLYNVRAYPTLLFINWKGEIIHRSVGGRKAEAFIELGKEALDDTKNFRSLELAYLASPDNFDRMTGYAKALKQSYDRSYIEVVNHFLKKNPIEQLPLERSWTIISNFFEDPKTDEFRYLLKNRKSYEEKVSKDTVDKKIGEVVEMMISQVVRKNDPDAMESLKKTIIEIQPAKVDYYLALADLQYSQRKSDWGTYAGAVLTFLSYMPDIDPVKLNSFAWNFYLNVDDQQALKKMTDIVEKAVKNQDEYFIHDTWAALLFKTKNYKQALKEAKAAISIAKKDDAPYEETLELIREIEKAMK